MKPKNDAKPADKPVPVVTTPRPGTREYREAQREDFKRRMDAEKRGRK